MDLLLETSQKTLKNTNPIFYNSKATALFWLKIYPEAQIYSFDPKTNICNQTWRTHQGLSIEQITIQKENKLYALKMASVPLTVLDIDVKTPEKHKDGFENIEKAKEFISEIDLNDYPYCQKTPSGGYHFFFHKASKQDVKIGYKLLELKSKTIIFLYHPLPDFNKEDLRKIPDLKKFYKHNSIKTEGRNNTLNKNTYQGANTGDVDKILKSVWTAGKDGLSWKETLPTALSGIKAGGGMPKITENNTPVLDQKKNKKQTAGCLSNKIIPAEKINLITPLEIPTGSITIFGGGQGEGKSTTILKAGALNSNSGDGRPMLIYTAENSINNLVLPWWKQFGGVQGKIVYPTHPSFPKPHQLSWKYAESLVIDACKSGEFALILVDLVYLMIEKEIENKLFERVFLKILNNLHHSTAFVCTAHLKKDVKDQPLIHHFRGGSDLTGIPDRIMYLRRGQTSSQRVIVKLKDRATGEIDGGFLTEMTDKKSDMTIKKLEGSPKEILKNYAEALISEKKDNKGTDILIGLIRNKVSKYPTGTWKISDYLFWAKDTLNIGEKKARNLLKAAGYYSKSQSKSGEWKIFKR